MFAYINVGAAPFEIVSYFCFVIILFQLLFRENGFTATAHIHQCTYFRSRTDGRQDRETAVQLAQYLTFSTHAFVQHNSLSK